jgi:hypothetical protein
VETTVRNWSVPQDEKDARIRRLEGELYMARETIVSLAPSSFGDLLNSYFTCETRRATYEWQEAVVDKIIEGAEPLGEESRPDLFVLRVY